MAPFGWEFMRAYLDDAVRMFGATKKQDKSPAFTVSPFLSTIWRDIQKRERELKASLSNGLSCRGFQHGTTPQRTKNPFPIEILVKTYCYHSTFLVNWLPPHTNHSFNRNEKKNTKGNYQTTKIVPIEWPFLMFRVIGSISHRIPSLSTSPSKFTGNT
jgi:hypothetical protein